MSIPRGAVTLPWSVFSLVTIDSSAGSAPCCPCPPREEGGSRGAQGPNRGTQGPNGVGAQGLTLGRGDAEATGPDDLGGPDEVAVAGGRQVLRDGLADEGVVGVHHALHGLLVGLDQNVLPPLLHVFIDHLVDGVLGVLQPKNPKVKLSCETTTKNIKVCLCLQRL